MNYLEDIFDSHFACWLFLYLSGEVARFVLGVVLLPDLWVETAVVVCVEVFVAHDPLFEVLVRESR